MWFIRKQNWFHGNWPQKARKIFFMACLPKKKFLWHVYTKKEFFLVPKKNLYAVTNFVFLWTTFCNLLRIGKLYLVTFLECKHFLVLWERTCLKKSCFPGCFWHSLFPLDIWWSNRNFFRFHRGLCPSAHPKKPFPCLTIKSPAGKVHFQNLMP